MAQKIIVQLVDDITGEDIKGENGETVSFALDGQSYTIDLTRTNADKFRGLFMDYVAVAAKVGRKNASARVRAAGSGGGASAKDVREWARANGQTVPDRGRIPESVRKAFDAAS